MKTVNVVILTILTAIIIAENKISINTQVESTSKLESSKVELETSLVGGDIADISRIIYVKMYY